MALTVEDQLAIQQLYARYNHAIDSGSAAEWAACFTPDGVFNSGQGVFTGTDQLSAFATGFFNSLKTPRHWTNNLVVEADGAGAKGKCYLLLYVIQEGKPNILANAIYKDTLTKSGGDWKFTSRAVGPDF